MIFECSFDVFLHLLQFKTDCETNNFAKSVISTLMYTILAVKAASGISPDSLCEMKLLIGEINDADGVECFGLCFKGVVLNSSFE